jgi:hypothetical protein
LIEYRISAGCFSANILAVIVPSKVAPAPNPDDDDDADAADESEEEFRFAPPQAAPNVAIRRGARKRTARGE